MAPLRLLCFISCLAVGCLGQSIAPAHNPTPKPEASDRFVASGSVLKDDMKPYATYTSEALVNDNQNLRQSEKQMTEEKVCEVVNTTESPLGLQEIQKVREESLTFYVRPKPSFKRLMFRMRLQSVLHMSDEFYTSEAIDVDSSDLERREGEPWTVITVKHYQHDSRGFNSHALRVTVGNTSLSFVTHYWLLYGYEGFVIYVEGGAEVLFNCSPKDLHVPLPSVFNGMWLMAGLLITAALLLTLLFCVWVSIRCRKRRETAPPLPQYSVYEEFDDEVLNNIRKKVEALRSCKSQDGLDHAGIGCYDTRKENPYVIDMTLLKEANPAATTEDTANPEEHLYQNVYSVRPTPAPRKTNREKTPDAQAHYQNLSSLRNSPEEVVDEQQSTEGSLADDEDAKGPYQNLSSSQGDTTKDLS